MSKTKTSFKSFILNENKAYLAQKVGDILTSSQELRDDVKNIGSRDLIRFSERIVNNIRRILHSNWAKEDKKHLLVLQKIAVALMKAIDEKDDIAAVVSSTATALEKLVANLGMPINKFAGESEKTVDKKTTEPPQTSLDQAPATPKQIEPQNPVIPLQASTPPLGG